MGQDQEKLSMKRIFFVSEVEGGSLFVLRTRKRRTGIWLPGFYANVTVVEIRLPESCGGN
jgi:hypothetical protein